MIPRGSLVRHVRTTVLAAEPGCCAAVPRCGILLLSLSRLEPHGGAQSAPAHLHDYSVFRYSINFGGRRRDS